MSKSAVPFLLLPIMTSYLTVEEYGLFSLFQVLVMIFSLLVMLNMHGAMSLFYFKTTKKIFTYHFSAYLIIVAVNFFVLLLISVVFHSIGFDIVSFKYLIFALLVALFSGYFQILLKYYQVTQNTLRFSLFLGLYLFFDFTFAALLIVIFSLGVDGRIIAMLVSLTFVSTLMFTNIKNIFTFKVPVKRIFYKKLYTYGFSLLPHSINGIIILTSDRLMIFHMLGMDALGIYTVGFQVGSVMSIVATGINQAWTIFIFKKFKNGLDITRFFKYVFLLWGLLFLLLFIFWIILPFLFEWFIDVQYNESLEFSYYIMGAFLLQGMYFFISAYLFYYKKNISISIITFIAAIVNIGLNFILIDCLDIFGAIIATIATYGFIFIGTTIMVLHQYKRLKS